MIAVELIDKVALIQEHCVHSCYDCPLRNFKDCSSAARTIVEIEKISESTVLDKMR